MDSGDNISRAAVEAVLERRLILPRARRWARVADELGDVLEAIRSIPPSPVEGEGLREAASKVCWFDWSDNDEDAVRAMDELRAALSPQSPTGEEKVEKATCPKCGNSWFNTQGYKGEVEAICGECGEPHWKTFKASYHMSQCEARAKENT